MKKHPLLLFFIITFAITWGLGSVAYAIIMTALYNATSGSIPLAFLCHWQINNAFGVSIFPDGQLISTLLFTAVALALVVALGPRNLGKTRYTEAVPLVAEGE